MSEPPGINPYEPPRADVPEPVASRSRADGPLPWEPLEAIRYAWEMVRRDPIIFTAALLIMIVSSILSIVSNVVQRIVVANGIGHPVWAPLAVALGFALLNIPVSTWVQLGFARLCLKKCRGEATDVGEIFRGTHVLRGIGASILIALAVLFGGLLLIVPGVIVALGWLLWQQCLVDRGTTLLETLGQTWALTDGHKLELFLLALIWLGVGIVGFIAGALLCCVGLLATLPTVTALVTMSMTFVYLRLNGEEPVTNG